MEDVGKSEYIHNTVLNSNINKRMSKTTVNHNRIWTIFLLSRVLYDTYVSDLFTNTVVTGGPLLLCFNHASQRGIIPYDKQTAFTISQ
jgi:hypothetical protein